MLKQYVKGSSKRIKKVEITDEDGKNPRIVRTVVGGHRIGLLVAALNKDGKIVIGHSKWNQKNDFYDAELAENVAMDRLSSRSSVTPALSLYKAYGKFVERAKRYFPQAELCTATEAARRNLQAEILIQQGKQLKAKQEALEAERAALKAEEAKSEWVSRLEEILDGPDHHKLLNLREVVKEMAASN